MVGHGHRRPTRKTGRGMSEITERSSFESKSQYLNEIEPTRKFDGKKYDLELKFTDKRTAEETKDRLSEQGYNVRIIEHALPFRMPRVCTDNWKIQPFYRFLKNKLGIKEAKIIMGFSYDKNEILRVGDNKKTGFTNIYPLIDMKITRAELEEHFFKDRGLPNPPKSGCFLCPFSRISAFARLKAYDYKLFKYTVALEERAFIDIPQQVNKEGKPQVFYPLKGNKRLKLRFPSQNLEPFLNKTKEEMEKYFIKLDLEEPADEIDLCNSSCMT